MRPFTYLLTYLLTYLQTADDILKVIGSKIKATASQECRSTVRRPRPSRWLWNAWIFLSRADQALTEGGI